MLRVCPCVAEPLLKDHEDQFGRTPLMYCVLADRLDCAEILLKAGASVNKTDLSQRTALHLAAQKVWAFTNMQMNAGARTHTNVIRYICQPFLYHYLDKIHQAL